MDTRSRIVTRAPVRLRTAVPDADKVLPDIRAAIEACGLKDGATLSFHHHLRNGDGVLNAVVATAAAMGLRGLTIAASSIFPVHAPLVEHIRSGVVTGLCTSYIAGPVGEAVSRGALALPVRMTTHGGRARAIECGDLHIDAAFVAAPAADSYGNLNGTDGPEPGGTMGYPMVDVQYADFVVALTDHLVPYPACPIDITQDLVDFVVPVASIGSAQGIVSGSTRVTEDATSLQIARSAVDVIAASGLLTKGFSFQTGAGSISLASAAFLAERMRAADVVGSFASGGITGTLVEMFEAGLFRTLFDVQCFDRHAVDSYRRNRAHQSMSASMYANAHNRGAVVNRLDCVILGAAEIDREFAVNVTTGSNGVILGGSGGHADTAAGAKLAIVTTRLNAGGHAKVVERVHTVSTPGSTIDVLVTEAGIAVNPARGEVRERLVHHGLPVVGIETLQARAAEQGSTHAPLDRSTRPAAIIEYRDGSVIDHVPTLLT
jgi:citrate lyase subunit alpha / citrate CoA-transferase